MVNITINAADIRAISTVDRDELDPSGGIQHRAAIIGVILNRVAHPAWPNNVWDVLNQPTQFQGVSIADGVSNMTPPNNSDLQRTIAAIDLLTQYDYSHGAGYFANPAISTHNVAGTQHDMFTVHDTSGSHTFVSVSRYHPQPPVPNYSISYANDNQTRNLVNSARNGSVYRGIMNRIQAMEPEVREAFMQELIAGLGLEEMVSLDNIQIDKKEYQQNNITSAHSLANQQRNNNDIRL